MTEDPRWCEASLTSAPDVGTRVIAYGLVVNFMDAGLGAPFFTSNERSGEGIRRLPTSSHSGSCQYGCASTCHIW